MSRKQVLLIFQTTVAMVLTQILVLVAVQRIRLLASVSNVTSGTTISAAQFLIIFLMSTALLLFFIRTLRQRVVFEIIFALTILMGVWSLAGLYFAQTALLVAVFIIALRYIFPVVLIQNVLMIMGVAGIAAFLGSAITWLSMAIVLVVLSVYDVIAVYGTRHMVVMFKNLLDQGVIFALIVPEKPKQLFSRLRDVGGGEGFFFLGSGDLVLPALFVASAARAGLGLALGAMIGSVVGLWGTDWLFKLGKGRPSPALPAIAIGTLLGFFAVMLGQNAW